MHDGEILSGFFRMSNESSCHLFPAKKVTQKLRRANSPLPGPVPPHRLLQGFGADSSAPPARACALRGRAFPFTPRGAPLHLPVIISHYRRAIRICSPLNGRSSDRICPSSATPRDACTRNFETKLSCFGSAYAEMPTRGMMRIFAFAPYWRAKEARFPCQSVV